MALTAEEKKARRRETRQRYRDKHRAEYNAYMREWYRKYNDTRYPQRKWTTEEDLLVLEHSMTDKELAQLLKRSWSGVKRRRVDLKAKFQMHLA